MPVRILHFGGEYILDQLLSIGVVREGAGVGTYYLDEETLAPVQLQLRRVQFIGYAVVVLVAGSLLAALLLQLFQ